MSVLAADVMTTSDVRPPRRLLMVSHNFVRGDGQGRVNYEIVRQAAAIGMSVTLFADVVDPELLGPRVSLIAVRPRPARPNLAKVFSFLAKANAAVRRYRQPGDIVVANGLTLTEPHDVNLCHFVHRAWKRSPVFATAFNGIARRAYQRLYTSCNARYEKLAYDAATAVVTLSARMKQELVNAGIGADKISVIANGYDPVEFFPADEAAKASRRGPLCLPTGVPLALFVGDLRTNRKGLRQALRAVAAVAGVHLAVVGRIDASPFPAEAEQLGVASRVHFLGFRHDVGELMRACDFFLFPSAYEPFGLVILEALACGLPVITTAAAGAAEMVTPDAGIVVADPSDQHALNAAVAQLAGNPSAHAHLAAGAVAAASERTWERMASQYVELFNGSAAGSAR